MREQKVVITGGQETINKYLSEGWMIISVTAQYIQGFSHGKEGAFCFVLQREITNPNIGA